MTLSWRRPLSYRNWFLYDNGLHHERVKGIKFVCLKFPEFADLTKIRETVFPLNNTDSPVCKIKYPQICSSIDITFQACSEVKTDLSTYLFHLSDGSSLTKYSCFYVTEKKIFLLLGFYAKSDWNIIWKLQNKTLTQSKVGREK